MTRIGKVAQLVMFTEAEVLPLWTQTALPVLAETVVRSKNAAQMVMRAWRAGYAVVRTAAAVKDAKGGTL